MPSSIYWTQRKADWVLDEGEERERKKLHRDS